MDSPVGDLGTLLRQLILALGAAMVVGSLAVVVRERRRTDDDEGPRPNRRVLTLNLTIGSVLTVWSVASLLAGG